MEFSPLNKKTYRWEKGRNRLHLFHFESTITLGIRNYYHHWDRNNLFHLSTKNLFKTVYLSALFVVRHRTVVFDFVEIQTIIWTYLKKFLENKQTNTDLLSQLPIDATSHYICAKILHHEEIVGTAPFDTTQ